MITRADAEALDAADPLAPMRGRFALPEDVIYLDGNSLGPLTHAARDRLREVVDADWGQGLVRSWNATRSGPGWIDLAPRVAAKIAPLIGTTAACVAVTDSTSVNLYKVLSAALDAARPRRTIVSEPGNFPTDLYIAEALAAGHGGTLRLSEDPVAAIDDDTAVLMLTEVDYRTGARHDMARLTAAADDAGALTVWDLAHSAGAFPVELDAAGADFAVGCGYKYLNGGPGAPAFLYVAERHQHLMHPLAGWFAHARPFAFEPTFHPADGIARFTSGTPPILSLAALDASLDVFAECDLSAIRRKSLVLGDVLMERVSKLCAEHLVCATPVEALRRGSQVAFRTADAYPLCQALIARGVIGDFRAPDVLRFGLAPLYLRYVDVFDAAEILVEIVRTGAWDAPSYRRRAAVT